MDWTHQGKVEVAKDSQHDTDIDTIVGGDDDDKFDFYLSSSDVPDLHFDPNLQTFNISCGVFKNGEPADWTISGIGFVFSSSSGRGLQQQTILIDGNPSTKSRRRQITLRCGSHAEHYEVTQDGVAFELIAQDNRSLFDYISKNEPKDVPTIFMPPQQSTVWVPFLSNADFVGRDVKYIRDDKYLNTLSPEFNIETADNDLQDLKYYVITYPANVSSEVYDDYAELFECDVPFLRYKRRGFILTIRPMIETVNWSDMTIGYSTVKDLNGIEVEDDCKVVQLAVKLRHNGFYYLSFPNYQPSSSILSSSINVYDSELKDLSSSLIEFESNVDWHLDQDQLKEYGLILENNSDIKSSSDGYVMRRKQFGLHFKAKPLALGADLKWEDVLQSRTTGYQPSIVTPFPLLMDLKDDKGYFYPLYPGWVGQCGVPDLQIEFNGNPWDGFKHFDNQYPKSDSVVVEYSLNIRTEWDKVQKLMTNSVCLMSYSYWMDNLLNYEGYGRYGEVEPISFNQSSYRLKWRHMFSENDNVKEELDTYVAHDLAVFFGAGDYIYGGSIYARGSIRSDGYIYSPITQSYNSRLMETKSVLDSKKSTVCQQMEHLVKPIGIHRVRAQQQYQDKCCDGSAMDVATSKPPR